MKDWKNLKWQQGKQNKIKHCQKYKSVGFYKQSFKKMNATWYWSGNQIQEV